MLLFCCPPDRQRLSRLLVLDPPQRPADEGIDRGAAAPLPITIVGCAFRLVHHIPKHNALIILVPAHHGMDVAFHRRLVLGAQAGETRRRHPFLVVIVPQVHGLRIEARVEQHGHQLDLVLGTERQQVFEVVEKTLRGRLVDCHLKKNAHDIQVELRGVTQFAIDHRRIVVHPGLHVVTCVRRYIVRPAHPSQIVRRGGGWGRLGSKCRQRRATEQDGKGMRLFCPLHSRSMFCSLLQYVVRTSIITP